jgi:hypothetical protein
VRSELQRVVVRNSTNVIRPICPAALCQVIISARRQAPRASTAAGAGDAGRAGDATGDGGDRGTPVEDLTNTEEIDVFDHGRRDGRG